jgi:phenylacetate-CoA ligase
VVVNPSGPNLRRRVLDTATVASLAHVERTVPFWPPQLIERRQRRRLRRMIAHAYATVPFYRRAMDERGLRPRDVRTPADLARLPLIDGATVQESFEDFLSTDRDPTSLDVVHTSGSRTGVRRMVYWDRDFSVGSLAQLERVSPVVLRLAGIDRKEILLRDLMGEAGSRGTLRLLGREPDPRAKVVISHGAPNLEEDDRAWQRRTLIPNDPNPRHYISSLTPFEEVADRLDEIRPTFLSSFGSYADHFLRFLEESGRTTSLPRVWIYTGDMVTPIGRQLARERSCTLYSSYQATEVGRVGFQCERLTGLHLNVDLCVVRLVDDEGRDVPPGEPGEVVASGLRNRALVLLNYRLDDRAVMATDPCPCGRSLPMLETLEGRTSEMLLLADGRTISSLALESLLRRELRATRRVQVAQSAPGEFRLRIVPFARADRDALRAGLMRRAGAFLDAASRLEVEFVDEIGLTAAGKFRSASAAGERDP